MLPSSSSGASRSLVFLGTAPRPSLSLWPSLTKIKSRSSSWMMSDVVDVGEVLVCVVMGVEMFGGTIVVLYPGVWVPGACVGILGGTLGGNRGLQLWRLQKFVERGRLERLHWLGCFATHLTVLDCIPPLQDREHCGMTIIYSNYYTKVTYKYVHA